MITLAITYCSLFSYLATESLIQITCYQLYLCNLQMRGDNNEDLPARKDCRNLRQNAKRRKFGDPGKSSQRSGFSPGKRHSCRPNPPPTSTPADVDVLNPLIGSTLTINI